MTDGGSIVNISSGAAYIGVPNTAVLYGVTKGALNRWVRVERPSAEREFESERKKVENKGEKSQTQEKQGN